MKVGDQVIISKELNKLGAWVAMGPKVAKIVAIKQSPTFGPAYTLEVNGERLHVSYWKDDIDKVINSEEILWRTWDGG